ncbi:MAG: hypothetical protein ACLQJ7_11370 [Syntrophobacteraceae bacterium]
MSQKLSISDKIEIMGIAGGAGDYAWYDIANAVKRYQAFCDAICGNPTLPADGSDG